MIPKGIQNLGNTCFLNACFQILLQTYELDILENQSQIPTKKEYDLYNEWKILKQYVNNSSITVISPNSFINTIHQIAQQKNRALFTGFAQNDMPEFLLFFIEMIHFSFSSQVQYTIHGLKQNKIDELAIQCYEMKKQFYEKDYSPLIDIFYGISISSIFSIKSESVLSSISESYFTLDLPICGNNIYDCLDQYISPEILENENAWFNEKTQQKENVLKQISFWNFPKILIITFKRFSSFIEQGGVRLSKRMEFVDFPLHGLDLSKYIKGYNASKYKYDLYGVCNHIGNVVGGHYTSFVKTKENEWFHCNDENIEKVENPLHIITPLAYSLFYRCIPSI
jgi:ubiquitin C-terminal hydrolase